MIAENAILACRCMPCAYIDSGIHIGYTLYCIVVKSSKVIVD